MRWGASPTRLPVAGAGIIRFPDLHPTLAVSRAREPLGVLDAWVWAREPKAADGTCGGEKESMRRVEGYTRVAELAEQLGHTRLVYVGDRESDMLELMVRAHDSGHAADYLLRSHLAVVDVRQSRCNTIDPRRKIPGRPATGRTMAPVEHWKVLISYKRLLGDAAQHWPCSRLTQVQASRELPTESVE